MARKKQYDPSLTGWWTNVIYKRGGYEWQLLQDEYIAYNDENLSDVAHARGKCPNAQSAQEIVWSIQIVVEAIDSGNIENVSIEDLNCVVEKLPYSPKLRDYYMAALEERAKRNIAQSSNEWWC
jgi:hypothetical protein